MIRHRCGTEHIGSTAPAATQTSAPETANVVIAIETQNNTALDAAANDAHEELIGVHDSVVVATS